jgi:hypothetical protein
MIVATATPRSLLIEARSECRSIDNEWRRYARASAIGRIPASRSQRRTGDLWASSIWARVLRLTVTRWVSPIFLLSLADGLSTILFSMMSYCDSTLWPRTAREVPVDHGQTYGQDPQTATALQDLSPQSAPTLGMSRYHVEPFVCAAAVAPSAEDYGFAC